LNFSVRVAVFVRPAGCYNHNNNNKAPPPALLMLSDVLCKLQLTSNPLLTVQDCKPFFTVTHQNSQLM